MKRQIITLDLSELAALREHRGIRGEEGYIVITPFKPGLTSSANHKRNKRFLEKLKAVNYAHYPVWGGFNVYGNNGLINKRPMLVKAFVVLNFPRASSAAYENSDGLNELGQELCKKFEQRFYLFKRKEAGNNVYLINSAGHTQEKLSLVSMIESADSYFARLSDSGLYGKFEEKHQFLAGRLYVPATPDSMAEAYKRYGEVFIKF